MKKNAGAGREKTFTRAVPKRLLKTSEAAVYLSCSTWKIRKLVMDGKLQYVADSDDTDWRFDIFDLDAFIDFNKAQGGDHWIRAIRARGTGVKIEPSLSAPVNGAMVAFFAARGAHSCGCSTTKMVGLTASPPRTTDQRKAIKLLERRRAQIIEDTFVTPKTRRAKVDELMEDCLRDYRINQRKSLDDAEARWRLHLSPFFAYRRAIEITSDLLAKYVDQRQSEGVKNATVNRELALLKRAYSLAARATPPRVIRVPHFPHLTERNIRTGFVEDEQYDRLAHACNRAGLWMRGLFECGYTYGWRISELENLRLRQVSLLARTIRLDAGTTKNDEPRIVKMTDTIYGLLGQCMAGKQPHDYVFTRPDAKPVRDFRHTWTTVCCAANLGRIVCPGCGDEPSADLYCSRCSMKRKRKDLKYVGLIFHDLRRTAIRNMIRAGIPEKVAMQISGHKTHSVFNRYNIVSERDLEEAARKLDQRQKETEKLRIQSESSGTEHDSDPYRVKIQ